MITALMVGSHSAVDEIEIRPEDAPLSYITWLPTFEIFIALFVLLPRFSFLRNDGIVNFLVGFLGGVLSSL